MSSMSLRPYQEAGVQKLRAAIAGGDRKLVCVSPTGSGKTELACHLLQESLRKGSRALFIVDRITLVDQTSVRFDLYDIPHGVIQANHWRNRPWERIQLCSAQTLERRGIPDDVDVIFVDEAHCLRKKIVEKLHETEAAVIGLTATPFTRGMGKVYSRSVNVITMNELIESGFLVPLKMYAAKAIDVTGLTVVAGEWSEKEIEERGLEIVGDIVSEWQEKTKLHFGGPVKTLVFSATVDHGEELCRQFQAAGFNFEQISYRDAHSNHREEVIAEFRKPDSTIHGLISCEVLTKGFDVPDVLCGISGRPYRKSLSSHMQQMGRLMRSAEGKTFGLWLCHSGNCLRFMKDVVDVFQNGCGELDDGKREEKARREPTEKERQQIRCSCGYVLVGFEKTCPGCGKERKRVSMIEAVPGQLVAVGEKPLPRGLEDRGNIWMQLCTAARAKHPGEIDRANKRALAQYRSIYNEWPPRGYDPHADAPMSTALANRLRHENIKWQKRSNRFLEKKPRGSQKPIKIYNA